MITFFIVIFSCFYFIPGIIIYNEFDGMREFFTFKERLALSMIPVFNFIIACEVIYYWIKNEHNS